MPLALSLGGVVSSSHRSLFVLVTVAFLVAPLTPTVGQSSVAISPFVSYVPSAARNPLAGMALTFGGTTGLALRGSADISVANPDNAASSTGSAAGSVRPWGADADAMLFLGGLGGGTTVFSRSLSPYVFSGIGLSGRDSAGSNVMQHGWSYGAGAALPLGFDADLFGEARWRMSEYVLPTSKNAPDSKSELRFGLSFHVGGGSREVPVDPRGRGRRLDRYDDVAVVAPATPVTTVTPVIITPSETVATTQTESEVVVDSPERRPVYTVPVERTTRRVETATVRRSTATATTTARRARGIVYRSRVKASAKQQHQQAVTSTTKKTKREIMRRKRS